jgi:transposase
MPCRHACCVSSTSWQSTGVGWISASMAYPARSKHWPDKNQACSRLMTVPGIGPIISSAMVAAIGTGDVFSKGRDFGAWLGLVPKQISTGDRTILGKISRRGNRYLRVLFVQAAWVVLVRIKNWERYGLKSWIEAAKRRLHHNVLAIALANKLARIAWAVLAKGRAFELTRTDDAGVVRPA